MIVFQEPVHRRRKYFFPKPPSELDSSQRDDDEEGHAPEEGEDVYNKGQPMPKPPVEKPEPYVR